MDSAPDPEWYFDHVLAYASPGPPATGTRGPAGRWQSWWRQRWYDAGDEPCARLARQHGFVLTTAQARSLGRHQHHIRREVRRQRWTMAGRGIIVPLILPAGGSAHQVARRRHAVTATGAALVRSGEVISGPSAAVLHGLPTLQLPAVAHLTATASGTLGRRHAAHVRSASLAAADVTAWFGAPVTTIARIVVDLARHDRRDGLMAADAALYESLVSRSQIDAALLDARGWPSARAAREVLRLAISQAESPLESIVRLALHDDGFPPPETQATIGGYRVDFVWPEHRVILEADGRGKYRDDELWREKRREGRLRRLGYRVVRVRWWDVVHNWPETRAELAAELGFTAGVVTGCRES